MVVGEEHTNFGGTLHGGMVASLVDYTSSLALVTDDLQQTGFSVDLNVTFVNSANVGDCLVLDAQTVKRGKSLAYLDVSIFHKETKKIIALGKQVKYTGNNGG
ncbi:acyl-coenzyme A thioesterase 13-like protein [Dinothrombium tinctorium]|nr:acyl-coenzyme A thioesterase 13-like protein [Dinothrombium tinctorium]